MKEKHKKNEEKQDFKETNDLKQDSSKEVEKIEINKEEYLELLKNKDAKKDLLYAYAEFENFKKRQSNFLKQQVDFANENIIKDILPVIDHLRLAKEHAEASDSNFSKFLEGIDLIIKQFTEVLSKYGVKEVAAVGEKFDPNYHEACESRESEDVKSGCVIEEYQKGYTYNGRTIRPSRVCVCINKEDKGGK